MNITIREEGGHTLLVGAWKAPDEKNPYKPHLEMARFAECVKQDGCRADWWTFVLHPEMQRALDKWPHFYLYQEKEVRWRYHVIDYGPPGPDGLHCPWPDAPEEPLRLLPTIGSRTVKTWFLVDAVDPLDPPITNRELQLLDGRPLLRAPRNGFVLCRLKSPILRRAP